MNPCILDFAEWDDGEDPDYTPDDIVAWTYSAGRHCVTCANRRFGGAALADGRAVDDEGNHVHPVFAVDEWPEERGSCGTCHSVFVGRTI